MMEQSLLRCLRLRVGFSCSSGPDSGLLSDPVAQFLEETIEVPMRVGSSSSLSGLSSVDFFPVCLLTWGVMAPSHGFRLCRSGRLVDSWLLGAGIRPVGPLRSLASSHSGVCSMRVGVPPCSLAHCGTPWLVA